MLSATNGSLVRFCKISQIEKAYEFPPDVQLQEALQLAVPNMLDNYIGKLFPACIGNDFRAVSNAKALFYNNVKFQLSNGTETSVFSKKAIDNIALDLAQYSSRTSVTRVGGLMNTSVSAVILDYLKGARIPIYLKLALYSEGQFSRDITLVRFCNDKMNNLVRSNQNSLFKGIDAGEVITASPIVFWQLYATDYHLTIGSKAMRDLFNMLNTGKVVKPKTNKTAKTKTTRQRKAKTVITNPDAETQNN